MKNFSFRNRIASNYIITTALLIGIVFITIFTVVKISVSNHLNEDLRREADRHSLEVEVKDNTIALKRHKEWMEREHNIVDVDPIFIEFRDIDGNLIDKSPNLKDSRLIFEPNQQDNVFYDGKLVEKRIRQIQMPIMNKDGQISGFLTVALSREGYEIVLETLRRILLFTYPLILFVLFLVARFIAGRSIKPINDIIEISNKITRDNLVSRIELPHNKDELYILSNTINQLLDRIQNTIEREKSFTSYASHEFRTPLAVLKGTLEVLIRKPRQQDEYEEKIKNCISEIDRLNHLVDELLILTRYENQKQSLKLQNTNIGTLINNTLEYLAEITKQKNIHIKTIIPSFDIYFKTDIYLFSTIITNIISNAVKYSDQNGEVEINVWERSRTIYCDIKDNGIGIPEKDIKKIFNKFYRSADHADIKGFGLGLPIVKRFCSLLSIHIEIFSKEGRGTTVSLKIPLF